MIEFQVAAMSCGHCVGAVTQAIKQVDPGSKVDVDLAAKTVKIESSQERAVLGEALTAAGYPPA